MHIYIRIDGLWWLYFYYWWYIVTYSRYTYFIWLYFWLFAINICFLCGQMYCNAHYITLHAMPYSAFKNGRHASATSVPCHYQAKSFSGRNAWWQRMHRVTYLPEIRHTKEIKTQSYFEYWVTISRLHSIFFLVITSFHYSIISLTTAVSPSRYDYQVTLRWGARQFALRELPRLIDFCLSHGFSFWFLVSFKWHICLDVATITGCLLIHR